jgi:hypothetical protein
VEVDLRDTSVPTNYSELSRSGMGSHPSPHLLREQAALHLLQRSHPVAPLMFVPYVLCVHVKQHCIQCLDLPCDPVACSPREAQLVE